MLHRRQHHHPAIASLGRKPKPRNESRNVLQRRKPPADPMPGEVVPPVLQVMGVSLDRVRRLLDRRKIGKEPLDRLDRPQIVAQQCPRLSSGVRHHHTLHTHRTSRFRDGQRKVIPSTTRSRATSALVVYVTDTPSPAQDNGRKRHIAVDTCGLLLAVLVTGAHVQDRDGARPLLWALHTCFPSIRLLWADSGYAGQLVNWARTQLRLTVQIVAKLAGQTTFVVLHRRWCVERTFSWINRCRRTVRDYERLPEHHAAMVQWSMIIIMTRRLARHHIT